MNIEFSPIEIAFLRSQLLVDFRNLRGEVANTDTHRREELRHDEEILRRILLRLGVNEVEALEARTATERAA